MTRSKRKFDANYKLHICELICKQGLTITQVCTDNSLGQSKIHLWLNQYDAELQGKAGIGLTITPEQRKIREIEHEPVSTVCSCGCQLRRIGEDVSE